MQVGSENWLLQATVYQERVLHIDHTDDFRPQLVGTPLASKPHLLAVPLPKVPALLIAARSDRPFGETDVSAALAVGEEAAELLTSELRDVISRGGR